MNKRSYFVEKPNKDGFIQHTSNIRGFPYPILAGLQFGKKIVFDNGIIAKAEKFIRIEDRKFDCRFPFLNKEGVLNLLSSTPWGAKWLVKEYRESCE